MQTTLNAYKCTAQCYNNKDDDNGGDDGDNKTMCQKIYNNESFSLCAVMSCVN